MRKVLFKKWIERIYNNCCASHVSGTGVYSDFIHEGLFHQWANNHEEHESGPANFTNAIVELPDGTIELVMPHNLKFIS